MPGNRKQSNVHICDSIYILIHWQKHKGMDGQSVLLVQKYEELYNFKNPNYTNLHWRETTRKEAAGQLKKQKLSFNTLPFITPHTHCITITKHSITVGNLFMQIFFLLGSFSVAILYHLLNQYLICTALIEMFPPNFCDSCKPFILETKKI